MKDDICLFCHQMAHQDAKERLRNWPDYYATHAVIHSPDDDSIKNVGYVRFRPYEMHADVEDFYSYCNFFGSVMHLGCWRIATQEICNLLRERYEKKKLNL